MHWKMSKKENQRPLEIFFYAVESKQTLLVQEALKSKYFNNSVLDADFCMEIVESKTSLNEILRFLVKSVSFFVYCQEDADNSFTLFSNVFFTDSGERFITRLRLI